MSAGPRHCVLDGRQRSRAAVLAKLGRDLGHPAPIPNLDALYDVLRTDIEGPVTIAWRLSRATREALGADLPGLRRVLEDVARERPDLRLTIEGEGEG